MLEFIEEIGILFNTEKLPGGTRLPGVRIADGKLAIDPEKLTWSGDILYGAGLLAVVPPSNRLTLSCQGKPEADVELPAMAWAYAAARHLKMDPMIVFHEGGYQNAGREIVAQFQGPAPFGVPMLAWLGLCQPGEYPQMNSWIREVESPKHHSQKTKK